MTITTGDRYDSGMSSRRGKNSPWSGKPPARTAIVPSEFERFAKELGLTEQQYADSRQLRIWCQENRHRCYIPEWLLKRWGIVSNTEL